MEWLLLLLQTAQTAPTTFDWANLIAIAKDSGFLGVVVFLFVKFIPDMQKTHAAERAEWLAFTKESHARFETLLEKCASAIESTKK